MATLHNVRIRKHHYYALALLLLSFVCLAFEFPPSYCEAKHLLVGNKQFFVDLIGTVLITLTQDGLFEKMTICRFGREIKSGDKNITVEKLLVMVPGKD